MIKMLKEWIQLPIDIWRYRRWITPGNILKLLFAEKFGREGRLFSIGLRRLSRPVLVRARSTDCALVKTVLMHGGGEYPIFRNYAPKVIIDAGANIGLATIFFKTFYPAATVIAIEPDEENCKMFEKNTCALTDVHLLRGGLWPDSTHCLRIQNSEAAPWGYQVEPSDQGFPAYTISDICSRFGLSHIDILKIDIEGSEREVLSHNTEWLNNTDNVFIELHDHVAPGASQALLRAIGDKGYNLKVSGENLILTKELLDWLPK